MKYISRIAMAFAAMTGLVLAASCIKEEGTGKEQPVKSELVRSIIVTGEAPDLSDLCDTKVTYTPRLEFSWESDDVLGIFPDRGHQQDFPLSDFAGGKTAKFDGGAWALRADRKYAAYFPHNPDKHDTDDKYIPVSYIGQKQVGNDNVDRLGDYSFFFSEFTEPSAEGNVNLQMKQLGSVMRMVAVLPKAGLYLTEARLSCENYKMVVSGDVNLERGAAEGEAFAPVVVHRQGADSITIGLEGIETTSANKTVVIYMWMAPQSMIGHILTLTLTAHDGSMYSGTITATKDLKQNAGVGFDFGNLEKIGGVTNLEYVEMGGKKWATKNLGARTVAGSPSTCFGDYYAYAEIEPRYTGITFDKDGKATVSGWKSNFSGGYDLPYPEVYAFYDGVVPPEKDAATQALGDSWRTPTLKDFEPLCKACGGTLAALTDDPITLPAGSLTTTAKGIYWCDDYDGVKGVLLSDGTNRLFFPAAGYINGTVQAGVIGSNLYASLWTSRQDEARFGEMANAMSLGKSALGSFLSKSYCGRSIRPVSD